MAALNFSRRSDRVARHWPVALLSAGRAQTGTRNEGGFVGLARAGRTFSPVLALRPSMRNWNTECEREERSFIAVAAVVRVLAARSSSA